MTTTLKTKLAAFGLAFAAAGLFASDIVYPTEHVIEVAAPLPPPALRDLASTPSPRECEADVGVTTNCTYQ